MSSPNDYGVVARPFQLAHFHKFVTSLLFVFVLLIPAQGIFLQNLVKRSAAAESKTTETPLPFQTIAKGVRSGIREPLQAIVRNETEWSALWKTHASVQLNPPPPPVINFDKSIVIAVFLGEKSTGGYSIEISSVERSNGVLTVSFKENRPPSGGMTIQAFTQPFQMVQVEKTASDKIVFRRLS